MTPADTRPDVRERRYPGPTVRLWIEGLGLEYPKTTVCPGLRERFKNMSGSGSRTQHVTASGAFILLVRGKEKTKDMCMARTS